MRALKYAAGAAFTAAMAMTPKILSDVEGTVYTPYMDIAGIPTVCEGITGPDVIPGKTYTRAECDSLLYKHIDVARRAVDDAVKVDIPDSMRASFYSFTYNIGASGFRSSTVLRLTNQGNLRQACDAMFMWEKVRNPKTGKLEWSKGLHNRRLTEHSYCVKELK